MVARPPWLERAVTEFKEQHSPRLDHDTDASRKPGDACRPPLTMGQRIAAERKASGGFVPDLSGSSLPHICKANQISSEMSVTAATKQNTFIPRFAQDIHNIE